MLRTTLASSRALRVGVLGLVTVTTAILITSDSAEARRHRRHTARHHHSEAARESYSPQFATIVVDGNTGSVLTSNSPDGLRHPASLTKIMTLYLLFERLDSGKMKLDTEMPVSEHASEQDPTKLGLRPGQTIRVEDAIKGLVTRSANDAAVVIAEAIGGSEDDFARMMTRKARALGMSRTTYRNASGLPNDEQITTARDQSTLGRAIQDRFPRYYRYFSTTAFNFRGHTITGHNRLLGSVEGVDGIKTGYTRASGFNLVTSIHRGNRFLVGVVLGGRSGGSRDATMRNLLAENIGKGATTRTAAAITERNPADANVEVADADNARSADTAPVAASEPAAAAVAVQAPRPASKPSLMAAVAAALPPPPAKPEPQAKPEPAPLTSGVIQTQPIAAIPGSAEPMKPVKVKTVQVKAGQIKLAAAGPAQSAPPITSTIPSRGEVPETSNAMMARAAETSRPEMPPQPANFGTGNGILGVLPASSVHAPAAAAPQAVASIEPTTRSLQAAPQTSVVKPGAAHSGWIIQVGALESEGEANKRIDLARSSARGLLSKADPFTEVVAKDNRKLYRARFAGLERDQAEAACKTLKRAEISCITVRN
ncbi:serine hydrolase [Bradyrhizobium sp. B120]|uniref:serine hydrolase n=1 Tax=Bradyrhizobium sp. B120 TaxID=3410088 RepID=UPI003B983BF3